MDDQNLATTKKVPGDVYTVNDSKLEASSSLDNSSSLSSSLFGRITYLLGHWGIETHGIGPIPPENRTDKRIYQMFFVWFSANLNILAFSTGTVGPAFFDLSLVPSLMIILVVDIIVCAIPAYFAVFGPKIGTRAMVQARYSWGFIPSVIPSAFNVFSLQGFLILNCIIGGQTLASVSSHLDDTLGIVIVGVISLLVTFCGYRVVHLYESVAWIPNVVAFIVMLGVGAKHINLAPRTAPTTAANVLSCATTIASSLISWCTMTPDYGVYHSAEASTSRVFLYTYLGFLFASLPGHMLGAAFAAATPFVPSWSAGSDNLSNVGGLINAILEPTGGFGKFLVVLIALTIPSACAPTMYSFSTSFMAVAPVFAKIPRYVYVFVSEAILIPVAVVGATRFYETFVNILNMIGYWSAAFSSIILVEHFLFRSGDFTSYDITAWQSRRKLPLGLAACFAFAAAIGIIVPCMSQVWYEGPIARVGTGDIGILTGFTVAGAVYAVARMIEKRHSGR